MVIPRYRHNQKIIGEMLRDNHLVMMKGKRLANHRMIEYSSVQQILEYTRLFNTYYSTNNVMEVASNFINQALKNEA